MFSKMHFGLDVSAQRLTVLLQHGATTRIERSGAWYHVANRFAARAANDTSYRKLLARAIAQLHNE